MRLISEVLTETVVHATDSGTLTVIPGEQIALGKSVFNVQRTEWVPVDKKYPETYETQLVGARGSLYTLFPIKNSKGEHFGEFAIHSNNSGQPMRKHGNVVRVVELGGIIEVKV